MSNLIFNFNKNFQDTVLIRKKEINQTAIDTLKGMESQITEWKNFSCSALNPHFKKAVLSAGKSSEKRHSCTEPTTENKLFEAGFQELSEKKRLKETFTL